MSRRHLNVKWGIITADINLGIFAVKVVLNTRECMRSFTGSLLGSALKKQLNAYLALAPSVSWAGSHLHVMFWDSLAQVPQFFPYGTLSMKSSIHALIIFLRLKKEEWILEISWSATEASYFINSPLPCHYFANCKIKYIFQAEKDTLQKRKYNRRDENTDLR